MALKQTVVLSSLVRIEPVRRHHFECGFTKRVAKATRSHLIAQKRCGCLRHRGNISQRDDFAIDAAAYDFAMPINVVSDNGRGCERSLDECPAGER